MPPEKLSKKFRVFYLGKMTRLEPLTDAVNRGGKVWYTPLTGTALAKQQIVKIIEEFSEVIEANKQWHYYKESQKQRAHVLEELSDVMDALTQMSEKMPFQSIVNRAPIPDDLDNMQKKWREFYEHFRVALNYHVTKPEIGGYMSYTRDGIYRYIDQNQMQVSELHEAIALKNEAKGPLLHGRTEFIALPKGDEWVHYFSGKFPTIDPDMLNPAKAWNGRPLK